MKCAWKELLQILPERLRRDVDSIGADHANEIRLRLGAQPMIHLGKRRVRLSGTVMAEDIHYVINASSRYSPWSAETSAHGYITAPGGHRIGLCGEAVIHNGLMTGFRTVRSVNIRIARDFPGIAARLLDVCDNLLILGPPGSGKTTLLRDLIRQHAKQLNIAVVDERGELFPWGLDSQAVADIITGCSKAHGVITLLKTMTPDVIAVDEITSPEDANAIVQAFHCGTRIFATAHALNAEDFRKRAVYREILNTGVIDQLVILNMDKSYRIERILK